MTNDTTTTATTTPEVQKTGFKKALSIILSILKWWTFWPVLIPYHIFKKLGLHGPLDTIKFILAIILIIYGVKLMCL
jgi:uncharacterized membrane protein